MTYFLNELKSGGHGGEGGGQGWDMRKEWVKLLTKEKKKVKDLAEPKTYKYVKEKVTLLSNFSPAECN